MEINVYFNADEKDRKIQIKTVSETITNDWSVIILNIIYWEEHFTIIFDREREILYGRGFAKHPTTTSGLLNAVVKWLPALNGVTHSREEVENYANETFFRR